MKKSFSEILSELSSSTERKLQTKIPSWAGLGLEFPSSLSLEQCSSEAAALYKRELLRSRLGEGKRVVDLCCGLGVDSWALAGGFASEMTCFEANIELAEATERNFHKLGLERVRFRGEAFTPETTLESCDIIYADPSRRSANGRKVWRLSDCSPDISTCLEGLLSVAPTLLLKLSPMADITQLSRDLGGQLSEVHIVSLDSEVKELLCLVQKGHEGSFKVRVHDLDSGEDFDFYPEEDKVATINYIGGGLDGYLLEPCSALLKAGAWGSICQRWPLRKLAPSTHLFTSKEPSESALFKSFEILHTLPFSSSTIKDISRLYPKADFTVRNLPLRSEDLQKRSKVSSGGDIHIFACSLVGGQKVLIVCRKTALVTPPKEELIQQMTSPEDMV